MCQYLRKSRWAASNSQLTDSSEGPLQGYVVAGGGIAGDRGAVRQGARGFAGLLSAVTPGEGPAVVSVEVGGEGLVGPRNLKHPEAE